MKRGEVITVTIEKFALGGNGLAFVGDGEAADGGEKKRAVFVEDVCVGDVVEVRILRMRKGYAEARVVRMVTPAGARVQPRCPHFGVCGGCMWQFLSYDNQLAWKERLVRETLEHLGGLRDAPVLSIVGCDEPWMYRSKMEWSFSMEEGGVGRWLSGGLHKRHMHHDTVNIEACFLQSDLSVKIFKTVRDYFVGLHERGVDVVYHSKTGSGMLRSVFVRNGVRTGEYMVVVMTSGNGSDTGFDGAEFVAALSGFSEIVSIVQVRVQQQRGSPTEMREVVLFGAAFYREMLVVRGMVDGVVAGEEEFTFQVRAQAFFQPNPRMAEHMYSEAVALVQAEFGDAMRSVRLLDLYCGTGTMSVIFSRFVDRVVGVDIVESAIMGARESARLNCASGARRESGAGCELCVGCELCARTTFFVADAHDFLRGLVGGVAVGSGGAADEVVHAPADSGGVTGGFDVVVVDPPRSGVEEKALLEIIAVAPRALVYVSCNPATFARDAKILGEHGYILRAARPFDQFPQNPHIEIVSLFAAGT